MTEKDRTLQDNEAPLMKAALLDAARNSDFADVAPEIVATGLIAAFALINAGSSGC